MNKEIVTVKIRCYSREILKQNSTEQSLEVEGNHGLKVQDNKGMQEYVGYVSHLRLLGVTLTAVYSRDA